MATTAMDYEPANGDRYEDDGPRYERDQRSASPRRDDGHDNVRRRSASPAGNGDRNMKDETGSKGGDDDGAINPGSNLFVTGIHPRLTEQEVSRLFEKYGEVEKCQIMRDPHTKESRGFGFVKMMTPEQADAAKEGLQGEQIEGRVLSIEKARRARPRTPTPGKYFGPPKREGGGRGGGRFERFDDRRRGGGYGGGGGGGGYGRDDPYRYRGYERRQDDRRYDDRGGYDRGYDRDGGRGGGGGGGFREDRGGYDRGYERGGGGGGYRDDRGYDRDRYGGGSRDDRRGGGSRDPPPPSGGYNDSGPRGGGEPRDSYGGKEARD